MNAGISANVVQLYAGKKKHYYFEGMDRAILMRSKSYMSVMTCFHGQGWLALYKNKLRKRDHEKNYNPTADVGAHSLQRLL